MITLVPVGGLANRMKAIDSSSVLAERLQTQLHIIWYKDAGLNCPFNQLFSTINSDNITLREASIFDLLANDRPRRKNFYVPRLFQKFQFDECLYEEETTHKMYHCFDFENWAKNKNVYIASCVYFYTNKSPKRFTLFQPIPQLEQEIKKVCDQFPKQIIGIHIRRSDNLASITESPTKLFIQRIKQEIHKNSNVAFYLATDSEQDKKLLCNLFGNRIITSQNKANRHSVSGMQDALVELYTLSNTCKIIGSSKSSYSETAAQINNIECELLKKQL